MCNRYRNDIRKSGKQLEEYGFEEFSETRIKVRFDKDIYPDSPALVVRRSQNNNWCQPMRWGFPPTAQSKGVITNVRNLTSNYWRGWLKPEWRCLVPFTSFCEFDDASPKGKKVAKWFAAKGVQPEPLAMFAGIWRPWTGVRGTKAEPDEGEHEVFAFLTTEANEVVKPIHAKAMPVILTTRDEWERWLEASVEDAMEMAKPLPEDRMELLTDVA